MSNALDITMDQGSTLEYEFVLTDADNDPYDLTNHDARLQVRRSFGATEVLINCTLANGKLTKSSNIITLHLVPSDTSLIRFNEREDDTLECVYDLEIQSASGKVNKPARGAFVLRREVTR